MKNVIYKGAYGWTAESEVGFDEGRVLRVTTMKRSSGKLVSIASVYNDAGNGMISMMMFQDYSKAVESNQVRVTEKAVKEQHSRVVANVDAIVADAKAFYAAKG